MFALKTYIMTKLGTVLEKYGLERCPQNVKAPKARASSAEWDAPSSAV